MRSLNNLIQGCLQKPSEAEVVLKMVTPVVFVVIAKLHVPKVLNY